MLIASRRIGHGGMRADAGRKGCELKKTSEEYSLLYDYYGVLLSGRQREVFELYNEENLSLSEIADSIGVSRQAVHMSLGKAAEELEAFEGKLGLIAKHAECEKALKEAEGKLDAILKDKARIPALDPDVAKSLRRVKKLIKGLDI